MIITTIFTALVPADATQRESLRKFFSDPNFTLFKEMVASRCIEAQTKAMNAMMYKSQIAKEDLQEYADLAVACRGVLETIDKIEKDEEQWYTVKLERR